MSALKKVKPEPVEVEEDDDGAATASSQEEEEEAMVALIEHRTKEVEHVRKRIAYYQKELADLEKRLQESQSKLVRLRRQKRDNRPPIEPRNGSALKEIKVEPPSDSPVRTGKYSSEYLPKQKPKLVISSTAETQADVSHNAFPRSKEEMSHRGFPHVSQTKSQTSTSSLVDQTKAQSSPMKRKLEHKEHTELIPSVKKYNSPCLIQCNSSNHIPSQHKRKLRSLIQCPVHSNLFMTSALDGILNLWQIQARGSGASILSSIDAPSPKQRRWPEDLAWHPEGNSVVAAYTADGGDNQIAVIDLNKSRDRVTFLVEKPHVKGIINSVAFMPWDDVIFVSGGSDHAAVLWNEQEGEGMWKPKALHRNLHTSAVMGVAGLHHKQVVLSAGADKRIYGFDVLAGRADYKHQIDSKCMSVLPNPCDFNLFLVQTGTPEKQLRLFDIRMRQSELHSFGWKQESSESQSALINQAWSPDGLYITSGSADPKIHIFDIRYTSHKPSQSVQAHQKRVFKAVWHHTIPLLISISSDTTIGIHKIS